MGPWAVCPGCLIASLAQEGCIFPSLKAWGTLDLTGTGHGYSYLTSHYNV